MIKTGTKVLCQYFNTPDNKFYGDYFEGVVESIDTVTLLGKYKYNVRRTDSGTITLLHRKEIKRILKS